MSRNKRQEGPQEKRDPAFPVREESELMDFLLRTLPHKNRDNIKTLLRCRQVLVDGAPVTRFDHRLLSGQVVTVTRNRSSKSKELRGLTLVYEDNDLLVVNKHAGILSVATPGKKETVTAYSLLYTHVKMNDPAGKIFIVHRLDRDTSGLMLFARSARVQKILQQNWDEIILERTYAAVCEGIVDPPGGEISSYLREEGALRMVSDQRPGSGRWAVTRYQTLRTGNHFSLLKVTLRTGRKNQIRVHLQDIGHPVAGDKKYGSVMNPVGRLALHAMTLVFRHPVTGTVLRFETPVPRKFFHALKQA